MFFSGHPSGEQRIQAESSGPQRCQADKDEKVLERVSRGIAVGDVPHRRNEHRKGKHQHDRAVKQAGCDHDAAYRFDKGSQESKESVAEFNAEHAHGTADSFPASGAAGQFAPAVEKEKAQAETKPEDEQSSVAIF